MRSQSVQVSTSFVTTTISAVCDNCAGSSSSSPSNSPSMVPSATPVVVQVLSAPSKIDVVTNEANEQSLSVEIPQSVRADLPPDTSLNILLLGPTSSAKGSSKIASAAVDLTFTDSQGKKVAFGGQIELCFDVVPDTSNQEACLGYLKEECDEWICEDKDLTSKDGQLCGNTAHFTSFAILIGANLPSECGGDAMNRVVGWLSMGFGLAAILVICVSIVILEVKMRIKQHKLEKNFSHSTRLLARHSVMEDQ